MSSTSNIIWLLSAALANQIAAGEVVQRPASVVKELVENAIDASSKHIQIVIKEAGKALIQVIDDGIGMSEVDARMSLEKHATSKINQVEDLFNIRTMGFRGEALPSIAAIAQVEIDTRTVGNELGTHLVVEGSKIKLQEPTATNIGTTISVKNLFFNVPARRNFLKSAPVEAKHIIEEFQHAALARPNISFSLYQNDQETCQLPADNLANRIIHLFGEAYKKQLLPCQEQTDSLQIYGYIGSPTYAKKTRGEQFFFVNKRFIKNAYLHHAVKTAFQQLIPKDSFPFYVLFMDIDPQRIDVNVHPTKTEIKFDDEKMVYAILQVTVRQALAQHGVPTLDFEQHASADPIRLQSPTSSKNYLTPQEKQYASFKKFDKPAVSPNEWAQLYQKINMQPAAHIDEHLPPPLPFNIADQGTSYPSHPGGIATSNSIPVPAILVPEGPESASNMQLHATYILAPVKSGLLLIDQHAAHERILYERFLQQLQDNTGTSQQLLFPHQIDLNPADFELLKAYEDVLKAMGFVIEVFGKNSIVLAGYPAEASQHDPKQLLENILEQIKWNQSRLSIPLQENVARSLAKHAAIQPGKKLTILERDSLVDQLFACSIQTHTPDGKKIWTIIPLAALANLLKG